MLLLFHNNLFIFRIICLLTIFVLQSPHSPISSPSMIPLHWGSTINQFRVPQNHSGYRQRDSESSIKIWESPGDPATAFYSSRKTGTSEAWRNKQNWERMGEKTGGEANSSGQGRVVGRGWGEVGELTFWNLNERRWGQIKAPLSIGYLVEQRV